MGASSSSSTTSSDDADADSSPDDFIPGSERYVGYRVLGVQPNSPASHAGLVSFFDFIVASGDVHFSKLDGTFVEVLKSAASIGASVPLTVYNIKCRAFRSLSLSPSSSWPGVGLLGVTIRFDTYYKADDRLLRVLSVDAGSPAFIAGLKGGGGEYLLGTEKRAFDNLDDLAEDLQSCLEGTLAVYVYDAEEDKVRRVVVMPTYRWGSGEAGGSLFGAEVGAGYLHRLPEKVRGTLGMSELVEERRGVMNGELDKREEAEREENHGVEKAEGGAGTAKAEEDLAATLAATTLLSSESASSSSTSSSTSSITTAVSSEPSSFSLSTPSSALPPAPLSPIPPSSPSSIVLQSPVLQSPAPSTTSSLSVSESTQTTPHVSSSSTSFAPTPLPPPPQSGGVYQTPVTSHSHATTEQPAYKFTAAPRTFAFLPPPPLSHVDSPVDGHGKK